MLFVGSEGRGYLETAAVPIQRYWYRRSRFRIVTLITFFISQLLLYRALSRSELPRDAIIYVNTLLPFGAMIWGRRHGRKVLCHVHEVSISPSPLKRFLVSVAAWAGSRAVYVSEDNLTRLPIPGLESTVVANPVAPEITRAAAAAPYSPRRSGYFEILMLASPRDFKGVPEYLELARRFKVRADIAFTLVLNGSDQEVARYLPPSRRPKNVTVHSRTTSPGEFYAKADLLVNLSRPNQWVETFGLTLIEGMAFGLPVIAPTIGGPTEIVTDDQEGYLCDGSDQNRLVKIVESLASNPDLAERLSQAARTRAAKFTMESFTEGLAAQLAALQSKGPAK